MSEKQSEESSKYASILKKITQDTARQYSYTNNTKSKTNQSKDYEVVDSSGGTQDNIGESSTTRKSNYRMYGTQKINTMPIKYDAIVSTTLI